MSSISRKFIGNSLFQMVAAICMLLQGVLISRNLGAEARGVVASVASYSAILFPFLSIGSKQAAAYFLAKSSFERRELLDGQVGIQGISYFFSAIAFFLFSWVYSYSTIINLLAFIALILRLNMDFRLAVPLSVGKVEFVAKIQALRTIAELIFVSIVIWMALPLEYIFAAMLTGYGLCVFWLSRLFPETRFWEPLLSVRFGARSVRLSMTKLGVQYAIPLGLIAINLSIDILLLAKLNGVRSAGIYAAAVSVGNLIWFFPNILAPIIFSLSLVSKSSERFSLDNWKRIKIIIFGAMVASIPIYILSDFIMLTVFGEEFKEAGPLLRMLLPGIVLMLAYKLSNGDLAARGVTKFPMFIFAISSVCNVGLNLVLIPEIGEMGTAIASSVTYSFIGLSFILYYRRFVMLQSA